MTALTPKKLAGLAKQVPGLVVAPSSSPDDHRSPDGLFRVYRLVFIAGRSYPVTMVIRGENGALAEGAAVKAEEERFLAAFSTEFGRRHRGALVCLSGRIGLDYFAIDCAQTAEGRLVLLGADTALLLAPSDPLPESPSHWRRLCATYRAMADARADFAAVKAGDAA